MDSIIGKSFKEKKSFTTQDVVLFSELTGDINPIHLNDVFAHNSIFGKRIVHGLLAASHFSKILGMDFPGNGTIYLKQNLTFFKPIAIDETVNYEVIATGFDDSKQIITLQTRCFNANGEIAIDGEACVKIL